MHDSLGNRIKSNYENRGRYYLTRRTPVIIRIDGKAFHTFTRGMNRPFDQGLMDHMVNSASTVLGKLQGSKLAYIQSDEVSILLIDYDNLETEAAFDYNQAKLISVSSSIMTAAFNFNSPFREMAFFDSRAFNIPKEEVANYFLWRKNDWERNSLSMYCSMFFSHKELHGKSTPERHEMLHWIGKNWATDCTEMQKNGTWISQTGSNHCNMNYDGLSVLLKGLNVI